MKISVIGSRKFHDRILMDSILDKFLEKYPHDLKIVSGGADGAETLAEAYADRHALKPYIFLPDWKEWGKMAGLVRNQEIVSFGDCIIAFWDGKSKGTAHSIKLAKDYKKPLIVVNYVTGKTKINELAMNLGIDIERA